MRRGTALAAIFALSATVAVGIGLALLARDAAQEQREIGVVYPFRLQTACGVLSARFDGRLWRADPPLTETGGGAPPLGWARPTQAGTMRLLSEEAAEFRTNSGLVARFVVLPEGAPVPAESARCR